MIRRIHLILLTLTGRLILLRVHARLGRLLLIFLILPGVHPLLTLLVWLGAVIAPGLVLAAGLVLRVQLILGVLRVLLTGLGLHSLLALILLGVRALLARLGAVISAVLLLGLVFPADPAAPG